MTETSKIRLENDRADYQYFNHLFFTYYASLCTYVSTIIKDSSVSEDIVQDLFVSLWSNRDSLIIQKNIQYYLFKAAKNGAFNYLRSQKNLKKALDNLALNDSPEIEKYLTEEKFLQKLEECINQLPKRAKEIFLLSRFEELKQKEIAEKLNISVKTIKNQIWKSLKCLKSCLESKSGTLLI